MATYLEIAQLLERTAASLHQAAKGLRQAHLALLGIATPIEPQVGDCKAWPPMTISIRARKVLNRLKIDSIEKLAEMKAEDFYLEKNCGPHTVLEIRQLLLLVGKDFPDWEEYLSHGY